ncbi:MAG: hypothetical protein WAM28_05765 [Chlamydiales bacterium]
MACEVQWNVIVPPATHIEIEGIKYPLEPKDPTVSNGNSFYDTVGKTQNIAHDKFRQNICLKMFSNKDLHKSYWLPYCAEQRLEEEGLKRLAEKGKECTEEEIEQGWMEYTRSSMRDNVIPEILERLETAAHINRAITVIETYGEHRLSVMRFTRYTPDREVAWDLPKKDGDLVLVYDNGYYRLLADRV